MYSTTIKKIEGNYIQVRGCFSARPRGFIASDTANIITVFKNEIKKRNIQVTERILQNIYKMAKYIRINRIVEVCAC